MSYFKEKGIFEKKVKQKEDLNHKRSIQIKEETQEKIFQIQNEKVEERKKYRDFLRQIENGENICFADCNKNFKIKEIKGELVILNKQKNKTFKITPGRILNASKWRLNLELDSSVNKEFKKQFIRNEIEQKWGRQWDEQLSLAQIDTWNYYNQAEEKSFSSILESEKKAERGNFENIRDGHLAEIIFANFWDEYIIDANLPFYFKQTDVDTDARFATDAIIIYDDFIEGIQICEQKPEICEEKKHEVGFQYTIKNTETAETDKRERVEKIKSGKNFELDDLVIVSVPMDELRKALQEWRMALEKNSFSTPLDFLEINTLRDIFLNSLEKIPDLKNLDLEKYWNSIEKSILSKREEKEVKFKKQKLSLKF